MNNLQQNNIRDTFGIVDGKTGLLYPDLISFHLEVTHLVANIRLHDALYATCPKTLKVVRYTLQMDSKLKKRIRDSREGEATKVIISYQRRTNGDFALARLYNETGREVKIREELK